MGGRGGCGRGCGGLLAWAGRANSRPGQGSAGTQAYKFLNTTTSDWVCTIHGVGLRTRAAGRSCTESLERRHAVLKQHVSSACPRAG